MSLRPAQALVQESSKFSLRHFFESQPPIRSPAELPAANVPTRNATPDLAPSLPPENAPPLAFLRRVHAPHAPHAPPIGAPPPPNDGKFTFTGLVSARPAPIRGQPRQLQHSKQALDQATAMASLSTGTQGGGDNDNDNDLVRLKVHNLSLAERLAQANANLASTSESVIRGNKALTTERAQFRVKYANVTQKLEATQAALAKAEALPGEDAKNYKLLHAKVVGLQSENAELVATRDALTEQLNAAAEIEPPSTTQARGDLLELRAKFTSLSAQHSALIEARDLLEHETEAKEGRIGAIEAEVSAANERAEAWEAQVADLKGQLEASRVEIAQTDSLVDALDVKLAAARVETTTGAPQGVDGRITDHPHWEHTEHTEDTVGGWVDPPELGCCADTCCPATTRCEEMERVAREALSKINGASEHECARRHEEWRFLDGLARRARHALTSGEPERVMVAHVATSANASEAPPFELAPHIGANPLVVGNPIDENCLRCQATTATSAAVAAPRDASCAEARTNAFVQAVSNDLKFSMDGSQALYASSASTGVALRV